MLTDPQKTNLRRHLGVPVAGQLALSTPSGTLADGNAGYRYFDAWGQLEYRMNRLNPDEEARLLGLPVGVFGLAGPYTFAAGVTFQLQVSGGGLGSPQTASYTTAAGDTNIAVLSGLVTALNANATLAAAGFYANNAYIFQPSGVTIPLPQAQIANSAVGVTAFTLTVLTSTSPQLAVLQQGVLLSPNATVSLTTNPATILYGYLPICDWLEGAVPGATQNLDMSRADEWYARFDEVDARDDLYDRWVMRMADFLFGKNAWTGPKGKPGGSYKIRGSMV